MSLPDWIDVSPRAHGLAPKGDGDTSKYLDASGNYGIVLASALGGDTLASNVLHSSLTRVGILENLTVTNPIHGSITGSAGSVPDLSGPITSSNNVTSIANIPLHALSILTPATNKLPIYLSATVAGLIDVSDAGKDMLAATDAVAQRTLLSLGTLALASSVTEAMQTIADNVTHNVSTTMHGYAPKGDGDTSKFLNAAGAYSTPAGGGGGSLDAGDLTGTILASNVVTSSLTSVGTLIDLTVTNPIDGDILGLSAAAAVLANTRNINGVGFNGSTNITIACAAGTLTGSTLASNVLASSLTSVGTLAALTVSGTISGSISGNAATATVLQTARNINGVAFDGSTNITVASAAGTLTGATLASNVLASSLTSVGTLTALTVSGTISGSISGNAATATILQTARNINGVAFDGSTNITVACAAGTLTGATLASNVLASSLTSVGTLANLTVTNPISGSVTGNAATATVLAVAHTINGTGFDGSTDITIACAAGTLTGATLASNVLASSLTSVGTLTALTVSGTISGSISGNAATATILQTARNINSVAFDGSAAITVACAAGTLTGATLASNVLASSLTSVGTLATLTVTADIVGNITGNAATVTVADAAGDTTCWVALARNVTGNQVISTDTGITFNATTNILSVTGSISTGGVLCDSLVVTSSISMAGDFSAYHSGFTMNFELDGYISGTGQQIDMLFAGHGGTRVTPAVIANNANIAKIRATGADTTVTQCEAATIELNVSGTVGSGIVPGEIKLKTANTAGTLTTAITVSNAQVVTFANTIVGSVNGNAATATALQNSRTINGTGFDGTTNITVAAAAGTLTGSTLASGVTASSLTSLGTIASLLASSFTLNGGTALTRALAATYTPTLAITANAGTVSTVAARHISIGGVSICAMRFTVTPAAASNTLTRITITLPVASSFSNTNQLTGMAIDTSDWNVAYIEGNTSSHVAQMDFQAKSVSGHSWLVFFIVEII